MQWVELLRLAETFVTSVLDSESLSSFFDQLEDTLTGICSDTTAQSEPSRVSTEKVNFALLKTDRFLEDPGQAVEFDDGSRVRDELRLQQYKVLRVLY